MESTVEDCRLTGPLRWCMACRLIRAMIDMTKHSQNLIAATTNDDMQDSMGEVLVGFDKAYCTVSPWEGALTP